MAATTDRSRIEKYLSDADFPADKDQLVAIADRNGADQDTLGALRGIPAVDYRNVDEVLASVTHDSDMTPAETAQANTLPDKSGLAQSAKDLPPVNPIVEELGENRGS